MIVRDLVLARSITNQVVPGLVKPRLVEYPRRNRIGSLVCLRHKPPNPEELFGGLAPGSR